MISSGSSRLGSPSSFVKGSVCPPRSRHVDSMASSLMSLSQKPPIRNFKAIRATSTNRTDTTQPNFIACSPIVPEVTPPVKFSMRSQDVKLTSKDNLKIPVSPESVNDFLSHYFRSDKKKKPQSRQISSSSVTKLYSKSKKQPNLGSSSQLVNCLVSESPFDQLQKRLCKHFL